MAPSLDASLVRLSRAACTAGPNQQPQGTRPCAWIGSGVMRAAQSKRCRRARSLPAVPAMARASSLPAGLADASSQLSEMRARLREDERAAVLMDGLRGANANTDAFARQGLAMNLVDSGDSADGDADGLPLRYDPAAIEAYWAARPLALASRVASLLAIGGGFLASLAWDWSRGASGENQVLRASQLRDILTSLGPAYIKLGQALSIRPDLLSPGAMRELQQLCDKVPSYPTPVAMALIRSELGRDASDIYAELSPEPVAAASLGQVYRGRLRSTGQEVAVKVQRPRVLETVTADLCVLRRLGVALRRFPAVKTDVVALLDEWAARFFDELDYEMEGASATAFAQQMAVDLPQIVVPATFAEFTSRRVLTSSWLEGEKLSQSRADNVGELVNVGVICYLRQLLDTGFFHADPHPGNMIRTPEGQLAVLDFGLMTQIDDDIKIGMIEAIAHLIHRDYEAIAQDFVTLQFIDKGVDLKPILPVLRKVFDAALAGGGAKSINFQDLAADLAQITFDYPFRIPPYFALIIRAISVLEGIALTANPRFAIIDEAYPFIAKMLLTDESPRLRAALRYMLYGKNNVLDVDRVIDVLRAFEAYQRTAAVPGPALAGATGGLATHPPPRAREALAFVASPGGAFFRSLLLDEVVRGVDASARVAARGALSALPAFIRHAPLPVFLPGARPARLEPRVTADDERVVANLAKMVAFLGQDRPGGGQLLPVGAFGLLPGGGGAPAGDGVRAAVAEIAPLLPALAAEFFPELATRLGSRLASRFLREAYAP